MKPTGKAGVGLIQNASGDKCSYMGHFRSSGNMKEGHNRGNPQRNMTMEPGGGMPTPKPRSTVREVKKAATAGVKATKAAGGDVAGAKAYKKEAMHIAKAGRKESFGELRKAESSLSKGGYGGGRVKAVKEAKQNLRQNYAGAFKGYQAKQKAKREDKGGGLFGKIGHALNPATYAKKAGGAVKKYGKKAATGGMA